MALGWSFINGCHRRDRANKEKLAASVGSFPAFTRRKLLRLLAPTRLKDRFNHATVIAGCCCIICTPAALVVAIFGWLVWWQAFAYVLIGALAGAYAGEFALNSWGCALTMPAESTPPPKANADVQEG